MSDDIKKWDQDKFERVKKEAEDFYKNIGKVRCPYFDEDVNFNSRGLDHIKFKEWNKTRPTIDQYMRLRLIKLAPLIIKKSNTLQGIWKTQNFERRNINSRWERILRGVIFFEFIAIVKGVRIKIIVKQVEGGEKYFWSIIPFWGKDKNNNKVFYSGEPEID